MPPARTPSRCAPEAAFAAFCGSNPIPPTSGKTRRHRLNRAGDRHATAALRRIVIVGLSCDPRTKDYLAKRISDGKNKTAREIYNPTPSPAAAWHQEHHLAAAAAAEHAPEGALLVCEGLGDRLLTSGGGEQAEGADAVEEADRGDEAVRWSVVKDGYQEDHRQAA